MGRERGRSREDDNQPTHVRTVLTVFEIEYTKGGRCYLFSLWGRDISLALFGRWQRGEAP